MNYLTGKKEELNELFKIKEAKYHLSHFPIKHENVLTYSTSKYIQLFELVRKINIE